MIKGLHPCERREGQGTEGGRGFEADGEDPSHSPGSTHNSLGDPQGAQKKRALKSFLTWGFCSSCAFRSSFTLIINDSCTWHRVRHGANLTRPEGIATVHPAALSSQQRQTRKGSGVCRSIGQVCRFVPRTRETHPQRHPGCTRVPLPPEETQPLTSAPGW